MEKDMFDFKISFTEEQLMDLVNFVKISIMCGGFSPKVDPCHRLALTVVNTYKQMLEKERIEKEGTDSLGAKS